jgi:hypothetical protein
MKALTAYPCTRADPAINPHKSMNRRPLIPDQLPVHGRPGQRVVQGYPRRPRRRQGHPEHCKGLRCGVPCAEACHALRCAMRCGVPCAAACHALRRTMRWSVPFTAIGLAGRHIRHAPKAPCRIASGVHGPFAADTGCLALKRRRRRRCPGLSFKAQHASNLPPLPPVLGRRPWTATSSTTTTR